MDEIDLLHFLNFSDEESSSLAEQTHPTVASSKRLLTNNPVPNPPASKAPFNPLSLINDPTLTTVGATIPNWPTTKTSTSPLIINNRSSPNAPETSDNHASMSRPSEFLSATHRTSIEKWNAAQTSDHSPSHHNPLAPPDHSLHRDQKECPPTPAGTVPTRPTALHTAFETLYRTIRNELEHNPDQLLHLNRSRRLAIAHHIELLMGQSPSSAGLEPLLQGQRSTIQQTALRVYFEELAFFTAAQILLLRSWADRGVLPFQREWLRDLNATFHRYLGHGEANSLFNCEGFQMTKPNYYSWYRPSSTVMDLAIDQFSSLSTHNHGESSLLELHAHVRKQRLEFPTLQPYSETIYRSLWSALLQLGFRFQHDHRTTRQRPFLAFTPTLFDGGLIRSAPHSLQWMAVEAYPLHAFLAEMCALWNGPRRPLGFSLGTGLELHRKEQLELALQGNTLRTTNLQRLAEIDAFDFAAVIEPSAIRPTHKNHSSAQFKATLERQGKDQRSSQVSLGTLQASIAINKTRPGSLFVWIRNEPLNPKEHQNAIKYIFDRSKLLGIWNLSECECTDPLPKYIYLFQREANQELRSQNRPVFVDLLGSISSGASLESTLTRALACAQPGRNERLDSCIVRARQSTTLQSEWLLRWPSDTTPELVHRIEHLKRDSIPLGQFASIALKMPQAEFLELTGTPSTLLPQAPLGDDGKTLVLRTDLRSDDRKLEIFSEFQSVPPKVWSEPHFLLKLPEADWLAPISTYLSSQLIHDFLEYELEQRHGRWILKENSLRYLPVPRSLVECLTAEHLPAPDTSELSQLMSRESLPREPQEHAKLFVRLSHALAQLQNEAGEFQRVIHPDQTISWNALFKFLPDQDLVAIRSFPEIQIQSRLPEHLPVFQVQVQDRPEPKLILRGAQGFTGQLRCETALQAAMIADQIEALGHPTFHEILEFVRLPRNPERVSQLTRSLLKSQAEHIERRRAIHDRINQCRLH